MSINDGGPAFPEQCWNQGSMDFKEGMSLRAYFAGNASDSAINEYRRYRKAGSECDSRSVAALRYADALIAELEKE